jgi:hypothetical protein
MTACAPRISPGLTGYSASTMCTSVPQIVVVVEDAWSLLMALLLYRVT